MAPFLALGIRTIRAARDAGGVGNGAANRLAGGAAPQNSLRAREFRLQPAGLRSAGRGPGSQPSSFASSKNMSTQARLIQVGRRRTSCWRAPGVGHGLSAHDDPLAKVGERGLPRRCLYVHMCLCAHICQAAASNCNSSRRCRFRRHHRRGGDAFAEPAAEAFPNMESLACPHAAHLICNGNVSCKQE